MSFGSVYFIISTYLFWSSLREQLGIMTAICGAIYFFWINICLLLITVIDWTEILMR